MKHKYNLALALGGGGARGIAHIGVLKVLERENIKVDLIVGTSMGAIIGGLYSQVGDASVVEKKVLGFLDTFLENNRRIQLLSPQKSEEKQSLLNELSSYVEKGYFGYKALTRISLEPKETLFNPLKSLLIDNNIEDNPLPFATVSLDLYGGEMKVISSGSILNAVYASAAIGGVFPPLPLVGCFLADGGPISITPVDVARSLGAKYVIGVDVYEKVLKMESFANGLEIYKRSDDLGLNRLRQIELANADLVIAPSVGTIHWANFNKAYECIRRGEQAAEMMMPSLQNLLTEKNWYEQFIAKAKSFFENNPNS